MSTTERTYEIEPLPPATGPGWRLVFFEGLEKMGGGIFPTQGDTVKSLRYAYEQAEDVGDEWISP